MSFPTVIFDFYGTLTPSTPTAVWDGHAARGAVPLGIPAERWREALNASFPERAVGALGDLPETIRTLARRCGVEPGEDAVAAAAEVRLACQRELFVLREDAVGTLERLRGAGVRIGVLSDCTVELADTWPELPLSGLVDAAVLSCSEGHRKPAPELFRRIASALDTAPTSCLYIGDGGGGELTGATAHGMTAVMLRADDWAANDAHAREDDWPGPYVSSLSDVVAAATGPSTAGA
ncbi:HAD family hydrolase [Streptomyces sp. NPDC021020]|uniref:HAD family hydrolase n=1 Tax=Streptomyces sp. NPDC021020 TaxID=3365109 RepID=UPI003794A6BB